MPIVGVGLYLLGGMLGVWCAASMWRALREVVMRRSRRRLPTETTGRRLRTIVLGGAGVVLGTGAVLAGALARGGRRNLGAAPIDQAAFAVAVLGLLLALGALLAGWRFDASRGRRRCRRCWKELTDRSSLRCPACACTARGERSLHRTRRSPVLIALGLAALAPTYVASVVPKVRTMGPNAAVPTGALVAAWPWLPPALQGELGSGKTNRQLSGWQSGLLRWQCGRVIGRSADVELVKRAVRDYPGPEALGAPPVASSALVGGMLAEYCSEDPDRAERAASLFAVLAPEFLPTELDAPAAAIVSEAVVRGLGSSRESVVERSAVAAQYLGRHAKGVLVPLRNLVQGLAQEQDGARELDARGQTAVAAIGALAVSNEAAWRFLVALARRPEESVQVAALGELTRGGLKGRGAEIGNVATELLDSRSDRVAAAATTALIFAGADPYAAADRILDRAATCDEVAVRAAHFLATRCPSEDVHAMLARMLDADALRVRRYGIEACAALGAAGERHRDALLELAGDESSHRELAAAAAGAISEIDGALRSAARSGGR
jgi:hypothetical protein